MSDKDEVQEIGGDGNPTITGVSSRGRVLRRTGINEKKMAALDRLKELQGGNIRPLDQYKVSKFISNYFSNLTKLFISDPFINSYILKYDF